MAKEFQRIVGALVILSFWLFSEAHARDGDYGELVERNLELRQQIKSWEEKYTAVENERNVLILHIRDLQNAKETLNRTLEELKAGPGDIPQFISQNLKLNKSLEEVMKRNIQMESDTEKLKREILLLKGERAEAFKILEIERNDFARRLQRVRQGAPAVEKAPEGQSLEEKAPEVKQDLESKPLEPACAPEGRDEGLERQLADARQISENEKRKLISQNEKFLRVLEDQKDSLEAELEKARRADTGGESGNKGLEKQLKDLKRENKSLETKARKLEGDLAAARAVYDEKVAADKKVRDMEKKLARCAASASFPMKKRKEGGQAAVFLKNKQRLDMHYNLALAYNKTGMHAQERDEYLACLKIDPRDAHVHYNLAVLYDDKLNNNRKAIVHYQKYLELMPGAEDGARVREWILRAEEEDRIGAPLR